MQTPCCETARRLPTGPTATCICLAGTRHTWSSCNRSPPCPAGEIIPTVCYRAGCAGRRPTGKHSLQTVCSSASWNLPGVQTTHVCNSAAATNETREVGTLRRAYGLSGQRLRAASRARRAARGPSRLVAESAFIARHAARLALAAQRNKQGTRLRRVERRGACQPTSACSSRARKARSWTRR